MLAGSPYRPAPGFVGLPRRALFARTARLRLLAALWRALPALAPALLFLPAVFAPPLNHDVAAVLDFSQRWLGGEHLYTDLIDVNPPLIYVLNLVPAWIGAATPLGAVSALQLCLFAWGGAAWALSFRVRERVAEGPVQRALLDVLPALFMLCAGYDFGQREHMMAMAAVPYVLCAARRATAARPRGRLGAALLAGVGFALKPHFLAIPALVELCVLAGRTPRGRGVAGFARAVGESLRDPVPWTMAAVWGVYLVSLPLLFAEYVTTVVPLVWDYYLANGGLTALEMLLIPRLATVLLLLVPLVAAVARLRGPAAALPRVLAGVALGALASALAQHKGWSYHIVPIELFTCALAAVLAARWLDAVGAGRWRRAAYPVAAVLTGLFALYAVTAGEAPWKEIDYTGSEADGLAQRLAQYAPGERVLVLSPGIYPIYPALNYVGAHNTLRTMNLWLLQGAYRHCLADGRRYRELWEMGRPEFFVFRTVAEDFARAPPEAVVIDKDPGIPWCGGQFDFLAYFKRHPLFAEMWTHYRLAADWDRYRIYVRRD